MPPVKGRDHVIDAQVGMQLRLLRVDRGLSQEQLGDQIGVTFQQIQKYETGANALACSRIHRLCEVLRITPNNLFEKVKFNGQPVLIEIVAVDTAVRIGKLSPRKRRLVTNLLDELEGKDAE